MSKPAATARPTPAPEPAAPPPAPETIPARRRLPEEMRALRMTFLKDAFQVFAFAVAGIWALASSWYQWFYVPRHEEPIVSYNVDLQKVGERDGAVMIRARLKMHNSGKGTEYLAGTYFNAFGRKLVAGKDAGPAGISKDAMKWDAPLGFHWGDRVHVASGGETVLPPSRSTVAPGEDMAVEYMFPVRRDQVDMIEVHATALRTQKAERIEPGWVAHRTLSDGALVMEASPACQAIQERCVLNDSNVTTTLSLWDDAGHAPASVDAGTR